MLSRPFGLPRNISMEVYALTKVVHLSAFNYKILASVGIDRRPLVRYLTVLDTGAGPNLIRADMLPDHGIRTLDKKRKIVNLASASNHRLEKEGILNIVVKLGNQISRNPFVLPKQLGADVLLGTAYIDYNIGSISTRRQRIVLSNGEIVKILRRPGRPPIEKSCNEKPGPSPQLTTSPNIRVTKRVLLEPGAKTPVLFSPSVEGEMSLSPSRSCTTLSKWRLLMALQT